MIDRTRIACIGQAGENQALFANIMTEDGHCAGRAGLGCVMGSKKLKAIALRGKAKIPMKDPEKFKEVARAAMEEVKTGFVTQVMHDTGTAAGWILASPTAIRRLNTILLAQCLKRPISAA